MFVLEVLQCKFIQFWVEVTVVLFIREFRNGFYFVIYKHGYNVLKIETSVVKVWNKMVRINQVVCILGNIDIITIE